MNENRKGALIAYSSQQLSDRLAPYFDSETTLASLPDELRGLRDAAARFKPEVVRGELLKDGFKAARVTPFLVKPFDLRWAYTEDSTKLWNEARPELVDLRGTNARFLLARRRAFGEGDFGSFLVASSLFDQHALHKDAYCIPMHLPLELNVGSSATSKKAQRKRANMSEPTLWGDDAEGLLLSDGPGGEGVDRGSKQTCRLGRGTT